MPLRRSSSLLLALSVAAAACSSSSADVAPVGGPGDAPGGREVDAASGDLDGASAFASGSRLKVRSVVGPDGAAVVVGFVDTALDGEPCTFQPDGQGAYRCIPDGMRSAYGFATIGEDCKGPQVYRAPGRNELGIDCGDPRYLVTTKTSDDGCTSVPVVERISTRRVREGTKLSVIAQDCEPTLPLRGEGLEIVTREPVPLTAFVRAHTAIGGTARLRARTLVGDDGSSAFLGWYDSELESECEFLYLGTTGRAQCVPRTTFVVSAHRGSCEGPPVEIARTLSRCGTASRFASGYSRADVSCSEHFEVRRLLEPIEDAFSEGKFGCGFEDPAAGIRAVGEDVGDRLVTVDLPARRLAPLFPARRSAGSTRAHWLDRELGMECTFRRVQDGALRCVPDGIGTELLFADAACASPYVAARDGDLAGTCGLDERVRVVEDAATCPRQVRVFELGAESDLSPAFRRDASGACVEAYYASGTARGIEVGLDRLAVGTLVLAE